MEEVKLNHRQRRFCEEFIIDLNATKAAARAGYSESTAQEQGSRLLGDLDIQQHIERLQAERSERTRIDSDRVLTDLEAIAFSNISDYLDFDGKQIVFKAFDTLTEQQRKAIQSIKHGKYGIELTLYNKQWALEMINKHIGFYKEKIEHSGVLIVEHVYPKMSEEEIRERIKITGVDGGALLPGVYIPASNANVYDKE